MQDKHIDELKTLVLNQTVINDDGDDITKWLWEQIQAHLTTEQLAILEGLKRESRELVKFNKTEPLNVGELQNVELIRAVPIEAIQQQIDKIGGRNA